jgi:hypothetical protein
MQSYAARKFDIEQCHRVRKCALILIFLIVDKGIEKTCKHGKLQKGNTD